MNQTQSPAIFKQWYAGHAKDAQMNFGPNAGRNVISFTYGLPDEDSFPVADLIESSRAALSTDAKTMLQYGVASPLARFVADEFKREEGLELDPGKNVLITAGSSQAIGLACRVFLDPGDVVLVEAPSFMGAIRTFQKYEARRDRRTHR